MTSNDRQQFGDASSPLLPINLLPQLVKLRWVQQWAIAIYAPFGVVKCQGQDGIQIVFLSNISSPGQTSQDAKLIMGSDLFVRVISRQ